MNDIGRRWMVLSFVAGALLGVALALNAGLIAMLIDDRLLWLISIAGVCGLLMLSGVHVRFLRQDGL